MINRSPQHDCDTRAPGTDPPWEGPPVDQLMRSFSSLGDNCEFGVVQRWCGTEPIELLRWMSTPLNGLLAALENRFEGLGRPENLTVRVDPVSREYVIEERKFGLEGHTFIHERQLAADYVIKQQATRLSFLKDLLLQQLEDGDKIFVFKSNSPAALSDIDKLSQCLRRYGNNWLLWVTLADEHHLAGSVRLARPGLLIGCIDGFSPYNDVHSRISLDLWIRICRNAWRLQSGNDRQEAMHEPIRCA